MRTGISNVVGSRVLSVGAVLVIVVALVLVVGVIPPVRATTAADIARADSVAAFQVAALLHVLAGFSLFLIASQSRKRMRIPKAGAVVTGIAVLLFGFVLADAASAFGSADPSLRTVAALLLLSTATDALVGASVIGVTLLGPSPTQTT